MLAQCWDSVADGGPALTQPWYNVFCCGTIGHTHSMVNISLFTPASNSGPMLANVGRWLNLKSALCQRLLLGPGHRRPVDQICRGMSLFLLDGTAGHSQCIHGICGQKDIILSISLGAYNIIVSET